MHPFSLKEAKTSDTNYVFILIFLILALGYFILLIMTGYRVRQIFAKPNSFLVGKVFYVLGIVLCGFRVFSSVLLITNSYNYDDTSPEGNQLTQLLYNALYVSDAVFGLMFFNMFWYLIVYAYKSHVRIGNVLQNNKNPAASRRGLNIYTIISICYVIAHIVYICLYNISFNQSVIDSTEYLFGSCVNNVISITYYLIGLTVLNCKFSGAPYRTTKLRKEMSHLQRMGVFWALGRVCETVMEVFMSMHSETINQLVVGQQASSGLFMSVIVYFILPANSIVSEIVPFIYSILLESSKIFSKNPYKQEQLLDDASINGTETSRVSSEVDFDHRVTATERQLIESTPADKKNVSSFTQDIENEHITKINVQNIENIRLLEKKQRKNGMGFIQKVMLPKHSEKKKKSIRSQLKIGASENDQDKFIVLAFRNLPMSSLSSWILQEINTDIHYLSRLRIRNLAKIKHIATDQNQVFLVSNFYEQGSLAEMIQRNKNSLNQSDHSQVSVINDAYKINLKQSPREQLLNQDSISGYHSPAVFQSISTDKRETSKNNASIFKGINNGSSAGMSEGYFDIALSFDTKMRIAIQIAKTLAKLHKIGIYHGHLSSSNILFSGKLDPCIADIGLTSLKTLMSFRFGYTNKSYFTAPEHLKESDMIVRKPTSKTDIYSFAFILFELFMMREAFGRLSFEELKKTIINDNSRPKIPENGPITKEIATIIRYCWLSEPHERPEFGVILANLKRLNNESLEDDTDFVFDEKEQKLSFNDENIVAKQTKQGVKDLSSDEYEDDDDNVDI